MFIFCMIIKKKAFFHPSIIWRKKILFCVWSISDFSFCIILARVELFIISTKQSWSTAIKLLKFNYSRPTITTCFEFHSLWFALERRWVLQKKVLCPGKWNEIVVKDKVYWTLNNRNGKISLKEKILIN